MAIIKMKKLLAENMRRFKTKNLNEETDNYKYYCEDPDKSNFGQYEFAEDIDEAIAQDDVDGIIMIGKEFINWLNDDSIQKGNYHRDETTGEMYQDRDDAYMLSKVPKNEVEQAVRQLESNRNNQKAKNIIQNIINRLASALD